MTAQLRIISANTQQLGLRSEMDVSSGLTIGRAASCDWVLPDNERFISSTHATIEQRPDGYYLEDNSKNGTFVNGSAQPVGRSNSVRLADTDRIVIGEYEIEFSVNKTPVLANQWSASEPVGGPSAGGGVGGDLLGSASSVDPLAHFPGPDDPDPFASNPVSGGHTPIQEADNYVPSKVYRDEAFPLHTSGLSQVSDEKMSAPGSYVPPNPPDPAPVSSGIPEDWDKTSMPMPPATASQGPSGIPIPSENSIAEHESAELFLSNSNEPGEGLSTQPPLSLDPFESTPPSGTPPVMSPPPSPVESQGTAASPATGGGQDLVTLLQAAGLDPSLAQVLASQQNSQMIGESLRVILKGLMEILRARAEIKNEFRVSMTQISAEENNPLKFCVDEVDALTKLLGQQSPGFKGPVEAFDEAFNDVKAHQMAMMAGMRAAFDHLMSRFNPANLQSEFDKELGRSSFFQPLHQAKYWEKLIELHEDLAKDSDANFSRLFGDEFAQAYEQQMARLSRIPRR